MSFFLFYSKGLIWSMALAFCVLVIGCGVGGGRDPVLVASVAVFTPPAGAIAPGAVCPSAGATIPTVTMSNPTNGNQFATTSTNGVANGGKLITATFSLDMNATALNAASFVLAPVGGAALVPASMNYNTATRGAARAAAAARRPGAAGAAAGRRAGASAAGAPRGGGGGGGGGAAAGAAAA